MNMNIDTIIDTIRGLRETSGEYYHNALGIKDERAWFLMDKAEGVIYDYLQGDDDWQVEDVIEDFLWACKFHKMNSPEIMFFLCYGYEYLSAHLEPAYFGLDNDKGFVGGGNIEVDLN